MRFLRITLVVLLIFAAGYSAFEARLFLSGPTLVINSPKNGATFQNGFVTVSGQVARVVALSLDGMPVLPDKNGSFSKTLVLPRGGSILTMRAADRFGHTLTDTRVLFAR